MRLSNQAIVTQRGMFKSDQVLPPVSRRYTWRATPYRSLESLWGLFHQFAVLNACTFQDIKEHFGYRTSDMNCGRMMTEAWWLLALSTQL